MNSSQLKRKLRDLKHLELLLRGETTMFKEFFAFEPGAPARYPFSMLLVFDDASRSFAFREYLDALWGIDADAVDPDSGDTESFTRLADFLGLSRDAPRAQVVAAFRSTLKDLHPDTGGDHELTVELIRLYRAAVHPSAKRS